MVYFNFNGKILQEATSVIGPDSRALRYGDGLFETMKFTNGKLIFADEHFARLWKGMQVLQFDMPKHFSPELLQEQIVKLAHKNKHPAARVRLSVVRGDGGLYDAKNHSPNYIIQTWALPEGNGDWNSNGLVAGIYTLALKSCDILSNLKHNNYLPYVLAALEAKKQQWNDAILLNQHSNICDSTIANIFIVKDEVVYTPSLAEGCVAGVMREALMRYLKDTGWQIKETIISPDELQAASEVFFTNSMYNIRWVQSIGDSKFGNAITRKIYDSFVPTI